LRRLLFALVIVLALLLGAEITLTVLCQKGMVRALSRQYGLPGDLEASIGAFPFIVSLARNRLGELRLSWRGECRLATAGGEGGIPYRCTAYLYDVELSMSSLMRGSLRIDSLSRMQAHIELDAGEVTALLGMGAFSGALSTGCLETSREGILYQYEVKVSGMNELTFSPVDVSRSENGVASDNEPVVNGGGFRAALQSLPLDAKLKNASLQSEKLVLEASFPEWEGYLESSTVSLQSNHKIKL